MSSYGVIKHQLTPLQFSDPERQQRHDVKTLFEKGKAFPVKSGTESGPDNALFDLVGEFAKKHNHVLVRYFGNWIAVDRDIIKARSWRKDKIFVIANEKTHGRGHDRGFPALSFTHADERMGRFHIASFHYKTHGRLPIDPNWEVNELYAKKIAEWMHEHGKGSDIALGAGDFNLIDKFPKQDWAFGRGFTSMGDELKRWPNTGHGPIDGFISWDKDRRVKAKQLQVLNDNKLHMFSDHFVSRGTWSIRHKNL